MLLIKHVSPTDIRGVLRGGGLWVTKGHQKKKEKERKGKKKRGKEGKKEKDKST